MSRRFRIEQEIFKSLKETEDEEEKLQTTTKYTEPVVWAKLDSGFNILDITEPDYDEVLEMIKEHFLPNDIMGRNTEILDDPVSLKSTLDHAMFTLRDTTSIKIVHVDDAENEVLAGALLLHVSRQKDYDCVFSRTILQEGEARKKYMGIQSVLNRSVDVFKTFNCDTFLRYYLLCMKEEYRHRKLAYQLMRVGLDVARSLGIHFAVGIFNSYSLQKLAKRLGFKLVQEVSYTNWRDQANELIFSDPGAGNYTCALMVADIPKERIIDDHVVVALPPMARRQKNLPRTRSEKRAELYKVVTQTQFF